MNYPLYIARKLSLSSGGNRKAPAVSVAIAAVALSVAVMMASIAIVTGFKREIRDKVIGFNGHITLFSVPISTEEDNLLTLTPSLRQELGNLPFITDYSLQAAIPAILKTPNDFKGVYLKGLNGATTKKFISENLEEGELPDFSVEDNKNKVVISRIAARQLQLKAGDKIDTYFMSDDVRVRRLEIAGIFNSHFDQYDDIMMFGSLELVQLLGNIGADQGTYLQIVTDDFDKITDYTFYLQQRLNEAVAEGRLFRLYRMDNVLNQGAGYFSWLSLLDTNVVVILSLMMIVGLITLVSGMLIVILEKKRFIGIMKSLGCPTSRLRQVFVWLAIRIALWGLVIGNIVIITLLWLQETYHFIPLNAEAYYIDFVPVSLDWLSCLLLNIGVLVVTYLVLILPSRFVAEISPAETMRYE